MRNARHSRQTIALTGATGYIASHVAVSLAAHGYNLVGIDNLSNSSPNVVERVEHIMDGPFPFVEADVLDTQALTETFQTHNVDAVIHLAGLKAIGESVAEPLRYYNVNVGGALSLLQAMATAGVHELVFSSTATVYRPDAVSPLNEETALGPINPYSRTKLMIEQIIDDVCAATELRAFNLRYFNPVGAHESGTIGEDPVGTPNNLMPFIMQVAAGRRDTLEIFGDDYPTPDGTCIRDYIHVSDLAEGHVAAVKALDEVVACETLNLGTGTGSSVYDVLRAAERAVDAPIPHHVTGRRPGDAAIGFADPSQANDRIGWTAERTLADACADHWRWQRNNPNGYR